LARRELALKGILNSGMLSGTGTWIFGVKTGAWVLYWLLKAGWLCWKLWALESWGLKLGNGMFCTESLKIQVPVPESMPEFKMPFKASSRRANFGQQ
jgi:hypothetical protein